MNIKIYYLNKAIILSDKTSQAVSNNEAKFIYVDHSASYSALYKTLIEWLQNNEKILYCIFSTNELLISFVSIFLPVHFKTMYAAGGLIKNTHQRYLFIYKRGYWDLPKGKIDKNETIEEAAIRECIEETGVSNLSIIENLGSTFHLFNQKEEWILKITQWYLMNTTDKKTLIPQIEEGIEKVEWLDNNQIKDQVINKTYPSIIDVLYRKGIVLQ